MLPVVAKVLAHCAGGVGSDEKERRRVRRGGGDDDGELHRAGVFEDLDDLRDRRLLLPDRVVDADDVLAALVENGVNGDRGLAGLSIADDQLPLSAADRHHGVDRLQPGLQRLLHPLPVDDPGRDLLDRCRLGRRDRPFAVYRLTEGVDHPAQERLTDRHRDDPTRALDCIAFLDLPALAQ